MHSHLPVAFDVTGYQLQPIVCCYMRPLTLAILLHLAYYDGRLKRRVSILTCITSTAKEKQSDMYLKRETGCVPHGKCSGFRCQLTLDDGASRLKVDRAIRERGFVILTQQRSLSAENDGQCGCLFHI